MITNKKELDVAIQKLKNFQKALEVLRQELIKRNPSLFPIVSKSYIDRIHQLQSGIISYLQENPAESPIVVYLRGPAVDLGKAKVSIISKLLNSFQTLLMKE